MSKGKTISILLVIFILFFTAHSFAWLDLEPHRLSLKGLKVVCVGVSLNGDAIENLEKRGFSEEVIRNDVELKLRLAGIDVISKEEVFKKGIVFTERSAFLAIYIIGLITIKKPNQERGIAYTIDIKVIQSIYLERDPKSLTSGVTWNYLICGRGYTDTGVVGAMRSGVRDCVDRFINTYLSVNPK